MRVNQDQITFDMKEDAMISLKSIAAAAFAVAATAGAWVAPANAEEVYVIRGAFNVFSEGMNQMTRQLQSRGVNAKGVLAAGVCTRGNAGPI